MTTSTSTSPLAPTTEVPGATVIPFPARKRAKPAAAVRPKAPADERLVRALAKLNAALDEQCAAVKNRQAVIGDLKTSTAGLRDGLVRYQASLEKLADGISTLHDGARSLEKWAEKTEGTRT